MSPTAARWFVFLHSSDIRPLSPDQNGLIYPMRGIGQLNEHAADYIKLHVHSSAGEYLAPANGNRNPNPRWFANYSTEHWQKQSSLP